MVRRMAEPGKVEKLYSDWREAEVRYAEVLAAFWVDGRPPAKVNKKSALALAKVRNTADQARDKCFKRVLT
jgi:hypothetical protein